MIIDVGQNNAWQFSLRAKAARPVNVSELVAKGQKLIANQF